MEISPGWTDLKSDLGDVDIVTYLHTCLFLCDLDLNSALRAASTLWSKSDLHHILYKLCFLVAHAIMTFLAIRL